MRILWHLEEPDVNDKGWHQVELHDTDAQHALDVDPDHWKTAKPDDFLQSAPEPDMILDSVQTDGDPQ